MPTLMNSGPSLLDLNLDTEMTTLSVPNSSTASYTVGNNVLAVGIWNNGASNVSYGGGYIWSPDNGIIYRYMLQTSPQVWVNSETNVYGRLPSQCNPRIEDGVFKTDGYPGAAGLANTCVLMIFKQRSS